MLTQKDWYWAPDDVDVYVPAHLVASQPNNKALLRTEKGVVYL
jgi:hypothetical protein